MDAQRCETCGNETDRCFTVSWHGISYAFDSFECAIHRLASICSHCGCRIIGHAVEAGGRTFCCEHCSRLAGQGIVLDHA